jgi:tyrosyl-tRNA synthetase
MSEARRLIQQGAVRVNGDRIDDPHFVFPPTQAEAILQVGPRRVVAVDFRFARKPREKG